MTRAFSGSVPPPPPFFFFDVTHTVALLSHQLHRSQFNVIAFVRVHRVVQCKFSYCTCYATSGRTKQCAAGVPLMFAIFCAYIKASWCAGDHLFGQNHDNAKKNSSPQCDTVANAHLHPSIHPSMRLSIHPSSIYSCTITTDQALGGLLKPIQNWISH